MKIEKWNDVHGNTTSDERMVAFLESSTDSYAVLQLKRIDETEQFRFMPYGLQVFPDLCAPPHRAFHPLRQFPCSAGAYLRCSASEGKSFLL